MSDNWVVQNLQNSLDTWNEKLSEVWKLLTESPQQFKGGGIWDIILILSRLVDTFFSRISLTMPLPPKFHNTAYVLLWEEDLHWQSRSSGCSSS